MPMPKPTGSNKENLERTRAHLLEVAERCFVENGFAKTSTSQIVKEAKSSRGSLYHHFSDKKAIFQAVYDKLCQDIATQLSDYPYTSENGVENLIEGCIAYLKVFTDQTFARIILVDGPGVLGMEYCRSKDAETAYKSLYEGVSIFLNNPEDVELLTDYLSGAMDTFALKIAMAENRQQTFEVNSQAFARYTRNLLG